MPTRTIIAILLAMLIPHIAYAHSGEQQPEQVSTDTEFNVDDFIQECRKPVRGENYVGLVWWLPVEFFKSSMRQQKVPEEEIVEQIKRMLRHTIFAVAVGKLTGSGIDWVSNAELRSSILLRDFDGMVYPPQQEPPGELQFIPAVVKGLFIPMLGDVGKHLEFFFFPGNKTNGESIADARQKGSFSIVLKEIAGPGESTYEWKLPLTSISPPKFCPVGEERVEASWNYCPWHGNSLDEFEELEKADKIPLESLRIMPGLDLGREPLPVEGDVPGPKLIHRLEPEYPESARQAGVSGMVLLEVTIDEEGNVVDVKTVEGHPLLVQAATNAVLQWKYSPTFMKGEPVPVFVTVKVNVAPR